MSTYTLSEIIDLSTKDFKLDINGHHGLPHWHRVAERGIRLALETGANVDVIVLFAYLHDAQRHDEDEDIHHGLRGADHALELGLKGHLRLTVEGINQLCYAIKHHSNGNLSDDPTIATCWDADRLDLWRVGVTPAGRFLSTDAAKAMLKTELTQQLQGA